MKIYSCPNCKHDLFKINYISNKGGDVKIKVVCDCCGSIKLLQETTRTTRVISKKIRYEILTRQSWNCNICGCKLKYSIKNKWDGEIAHIDHIHPYSKRDIYSNGEENINELSNLQALCPACNMAKGKKEIN